MPSLKHHRLLVEICNQSYREYKYEESDAHDESLTHEHLDVNLAKSIVSKEMKHLDNLKVGEYHVKEGTSEAGKLWVRMAEEYLDTHCPAEHHNCNDDKVHSATWNCSTNGVNDRLDW